MPRDVNQAQKAAEQRLAKREQKQEPSRPVRHSAPGWVQKASGWPLHEALLARKWDEQNALATILVARRSPQGQIAEGDFLVDLACLGVKSTTIHLYKTQREYAESRRRKVVDTQPMASANPDLVAKILETAVAYAGQFGFDPDPAPIYYQARMLLADANPDACPTPVPVGGPEGKPHFVAGPYDDVQQIMAKLTRAVGPEGFNYTVFFGEPDFFDE